MYGKNHSAETLLKMSEVRSNKVYVYTNTNPQFYYKPLIVKQKLLFILNVVIQRFLNIKILVNLI